ncbi:hypothetical protein GG804_14060 [Sphingomonas histidinilytica]|uniref:hypothetical protein n=1 Tax=Rhizorhabdus histidinilytica TaxID=439228 RepID=UPI001ADD5B8E|nr:hypothetical protein [Rhizorhabdus histidinilytica]MBO9377894.1 hypothetical protein [Rhizorhabdus histidinilytica]
MTSIFSAFAARFGIQPPPPPTLAERIKADHDRALAERRAARPARRHAGEVAHATAQEREQRLAADPIWQNRDAYVGGRR